MKRKCLAVGIILLFVGTGIIPAIAQDTKKPLPASRGDWLYVGGDGPGNYTKIQDAINHANPGDTVFVYDDSSPYYEEVRIRTPNISLIGEDKNTTIFHGTVRSALFFHSNNCRVSGFSIFGIDIESGSNYNIISGNNITGYKNGIHILNDSNNNIISWNYIYNNWINGIWDWGEQTSIINNTISNNSYRGINCDIGSYCRIYNNIIEKNGVGTESGCGIMISGSYDKNYESHYYISKNLISDNPTGLYILDSYYNTIERNDFINNSVNAFFIYENYGASHNSWLRNYWSDSKLGILPKFIHGEKTWGGFIYLSIPWFNIDWFPRKIPYNIGE